MDATYALRLRERIRGRVQMDPGGCWLFVGSVFPNGYGQLFDGERRSAAAHRTSYRAFKGEIPQGFQIDHLCKTPRCINPDHLEAVTPRVNNARSDSPSAINARKTHCIHGHRLDAENTYTRPTTGYRECVICKRARSHAVCLKASARYRERYANEPEFRQTVLDKSRADNRRRVQKKLDAALREQVAS